MVARSFAIAGVALIVLGATLFFLLGAYLGGIEPGIARAIGVDGVGYYFGATAGSAMIGWGSILLATRHADAAQSGVALGTGFGLLALALMRLWTALAGNAALASFAILLPGETVVFLACALWFFHLSFGFFDRLRDGLRSLRAAPIWVQVWVWAFLLPVNLASFGVYARTGHPLAGWAALGFVFVVLTNMTLVVRERGISRLTSLPHLIPWVPLQIWAGALIFLPNADMQPEVLVFAWAYFLIVGVSNLFDAYDTLRWFRGEREVLGGNPH